MTVKICFCTGIAVFLVLGAASQAAANCAMFHEGYSAEQDGSSVVICLDSTDGLKCPAESPMLRENAETGEVVQLADFCSPEGRTSCYVDECVPAGLYRYGLKEPMECHATSCGSSADLFVEIDVLEPPESCELSAENEGPLPHEPSLLWQGGELSTIYCGSDGPLGSCSVAAPGALNVLGLNFAVALLGIFLAWRRRRGHP